MLQTNFEGHKPSKGKAHWRRDKSNIILEARKEVNVHSLRRHKKNDSQPIVEKPGSNLIYITEHKDWWHPLSLELWGIARVKEESELEIRRSSRFLREALSPSQSPSFLLPQQRLEFYSQQRVPQNLEDS